MELRSCHLLRILRGFSRSVKCDSVACEASGGRRLFRLLRAVSEIRAEPQASLSGSLSPL